MSGLPEDDLRSKIREAFGFDATLAFEMEGGRNGMMNLSAGERARLESLRSEKRRAEWLLGRRALKRVLNDLGKSQDTSLLNFPNSFCSLSHARGCAAAVGFQPGSFSGVGIDLELRRPISADLARFFLSPEEGRMIREEPSGAGDLIRLWAIKEALFKADPGNAATRLSNYLPDLIFHDQGKAYSKANPRLRLQYLALEVGPLTERFQKGWLALACSF